MVPACLIGMQACRKALRKGPGAIGRTRRRRRNRLSSEFEQAEDLSGSHIGIGAGCSPRPMFRGVTAALPFSYEIQPAKLKEIDDFTALFLFPLPRISWPFEDAAVGP